MATRPTPPGPPTDGQLPPGAVLFRVYETLGVPGGVETGWLNRARHNPLGSLQALEMRPEFSADARPEQLLPNEAGRACLVLARIEGPLLEPAVQRGPLHPGEARSLMPRVAAGLAAVPVPRKVCDISPGHLMLPRGRRGGNE